MRMLLDSGAAISVVRIDALSENCRKQMTMTPKIAVGANGFPLKVMGQVAVKISLDTFQATETLVVVQDSASLEQIACLVTKLHVMDFRTNTLHLGNHTIPLRFLLVNLMPFTTSLYILQRICRFLGGQYDVDW